MASWSTTTTTKQARGYGGPWDQLRKQTMKRDNYMCQPCKKLGFITNATQVDHIVPKSKGGTDDLSNLQAICNDCHKIKTNIDNGGSPIRVTTIIRSNGLPIDW